ncbi:hypothetical protein [Paenirhodobacter populi]|uniref:Polysaccharide pyruvyl transferase family protein n=1 Tax=Paenirhodobacter populi TaxID=2306993 RepID=A0A443JHE1_9RHOB|nr:hypothetical protein [Sinirhodobacter populi]RWR19910.1 hypothetical protein D2T30_13185 [Sinirhodobacter populi]
MTTRETLTIYLDPATLRRAERGEHNFFARLRGAVEGRGWRVIFAENTLANRLAAPGRPGYALWHMEEPTHDRALTCRRRYLGAFWNIEAVAARWDWPIVAEPFDPDTVPDTAGSFVAGWRRRLWPEGIETRDDGHIFMPLQGRLLDHRGFQSMSPLGMIRQTLAHSGRPVIATLHPNEDYSADEIAALETLAAAHSRLTVRRDGSMEALATCNRVVTQNSALALHGYFLRKPAVLFARIDFHHIAGSVPRDGLDAAFAPRPAPAFDRYLYWFLQMRSINAGRPECEDQILATLRGHDWPL